ncbi:unnamed protein product, partial [Polarella glacialis]
ASFELFARSPGLRRSASSGAVGPRREPSAGRSVGGFASAPRRRPYESSAPLYATPDRGGQEHSGSHAPGYGGGSFMHKADALHLESRLTERLREHSLASAETRRPYADPRRRPSSQAVSGPPPANKWAPPRHLGADDSYVSHGYQSFLDPRHQDVHSASGQSHAWQERRAAPSATASPCPG